MIVKTTHGDVTVARMDAGENCFRPELLDALAGMAALIRSRLTPQVAFEAMATGRRWGGADAQAAAIVGDAVAGDGDAVVAAAVERVAPLVGRQRTIVRAIKRELHGATLAALDDARLDRSLLPETLRAPAA
jgi:enoyl-CoA hydratase/carnithine racemase